MKENIKTQLQMVGTPLQLSLNALLFIHRGPKRRGPINARYIE